jgi:hypothetical protein
MKNVGWETRPLGWSLIILVIGLILYFVFKKMPQNEEKKGGTL